MIRKERGEYVAECDDCGTEAYGGTTETFMAFLDEIKKQGWKAKNNGGDWEHFCPGCVEERGL